VGQGVRIMNLFACSNFIKGYSLAFTVYARTLIKRLKNSIWLNQCNLILFQPRFNAHAYISWLWALYNSSKLAMQLQTAANLTSCAYINREFVDRSLNCNVHHVVIRSIDPVLLCRAGLSSGSRTTTLGNEWWIKWINLDIAGYRPIVQPLLRVAFTRQFKVLSLVCQLSANL